MKPTKAGARQQQKNDADSLQLHHVPSCFGENVKKAVHAYNHTSTPTIDHARPLAHPAQRRWSQCEKLTWSAATVCGTPTSCRAVVHTAFRPLSAAANTRSAPRHITKPTHRPTPTARSPTTCQHPRSHESSLLRSSGGRAQQPVWSLFISTSHELVPCPGVPLLYNGVGDGDQGRVGG